MESVMPQAVLIQEESSGAGPMRHYCDQKGFSFTHLASEERALQFLQDGKADLLFVDSGFLKDHAEMIPPPAAGGGMSFPPLSFVLTTPAHLPIALDAMRRGAFDYILRPVRSDEVEMKIERALDATRWLDRRIERILGGIREKKAQLHRVIIEEIERVLIKKVLEKTRGNKIRASDVLGINRNTLHKKMRAYSMP